MANARSPSRPGGFWGLFRRLLMVMLVLALLGPPLAVVIYRFVPVPITILMIEREFQGHGLDHRWVSIERISPAMVRSVIASEDAQFCVHHGFDFHAIDKAIKHNEQRPNKVRGGSTISQQTAKNVFLWPERSWVRKGLEAWYTVLIETVWGKRRIMEAYLNTVELGSGIYGVEAASQHYFHESAAHLTPEQASRLAAILPSPLKWKAVDPGSYVRKRTGRIDARSGTVARDGLAACVEG